MKTKKMNFARALSACVLTAVIAVAAVPAGVTASANSGPSHWSGVTAAGTTFTDENCPIEAESELLTFNIPEFLDHGAEKEDMQKYSAFFSAAYTFKNPTQNEITATLAFPLGERSDYGYYEDGSGGVAGGENYVYLEDLLEEKNMYKVQVGGKDIKAEMRHTFHGYNDFDFSLESKRLKDGFRTHEFFTRDMPVYKYKITFSSDYKDYFYAHAKIKSEKKVVFGGSYGSDLVYGDGVNEVNYYVENGEEISLYSIGGEINTADIEWKFYRTGGYFGLIEKKVNAQAEVLPKTETTTFENYVFAGYSGGKGVSESDFYNAALDYIDTYYERSTLPENFKSLDVTSRLMRWLVYDLHFSAGETVENTVSAPLFPGGYYYYSPYVYTYEYLLSPAKNWSDFKSLEIRINTPYYVTASSVQFEKTEYGYVYRADSLPDGELTFEMCTEENPVKHTNGGYVALAVIVIVCIAAAVVIPLAIIIIVIVLIVKRSKKSGKDKGAKPAGDFKPNNFADGENRN